MVKDITKAGLVLPLNSALELLVHLTSELTPARTVLNAVSRLKTRIEVFVSRHAAYESS